MVVRRFSCCVIAVLCAPTSVAGYSAAAAGRHASTAGRHASTAASSRSPPPRSFFNFDLLKDATGGLKGTFDRLTDLRVARASHILLKGYDDATLEQMQRWREDIADDAEKFAERARESSLCPSRAKGGDLGYFTRGKSAPTRPPRATPVPAALRRACVY